MIKFIYSEKSTKFCKISTLLLSYVVLVISRMEILQNFVAFLEYMNLMNFLDCCLKKSTYEKYFFKKLRISYIIVDSEKFQSTKSSIELIRLGTYVG